MNIPPNSQPIPSNDPSIPPKDLTNAPIEKLPTEILKHIISFVNDDKGMESAASTKKPLTKITVDEAKKNSTDEIKELVKDFSKLMDRIVSKIVDNNAFVETNHSVPEAEKKAILETNEKVIEEVKNLRQEILAFREGKVLGSDNLLVNLLDVKSSMIDAKIDLAKLISKVGKIEGIQTNEELDVIDIVGTSKIAKDIMYLAECYLQIDELMPFEDGYIPSGLIKKLIASGDLPEAFRIAAFSEEEPFNFSQELYDRKIPESILDKIEMVVDTLSKSEFKTESLIILSEKHLENENLDKSLKNFEKIPIDEHLNPKMYSSIKDIAFKLRDTAFKFVSMGDFEKAEKIINSLPETIKSILLEIVEEKKADQAIIKEFAGVSSIGINEVQSLFESIDKLDNEKKASVYKAVFNELFWNHSINELNAYVQNLAPEIKEVLIPLIDSLKIKYSKRFDKLNEYTAKYKLTS